MIVGRITFGPAAPVSLPLMPPLPPVVKKSSTVTQLLTGVVGRIDWGYFAAGAINGYRVSKSADGVWTMTGTLVNFDAFKIRQRNLIFVAPHKHGEWRWPIKTLDLGVGEGTGPREVRATLGPQCPQVITGAQHV
jgi:hypothetical protein